MKRVRWQSVGLVGAFAMAGCGASSSQFSPRREWVASRTRLDAVDAIEAPKIAPRTPVTAPSVRRLTLENGMTACLVEKRGPATFVLHLATPVGRSAGSYAAATLWQSAVPKHPFDGGDAAKGATALANLGVKIFTTGDIEATGQRLYGLSRDIDPILFIESTVFADTAFTERSLASARAAVKARAAGIGDDGESLWLSTASAAVLPEGAWARSLTPALAAETDRVTVEEVARAQLVATAPSNVTLIAAGDFATDALIERLQATFGRGAEGRAPEPRPRPSTAAPTDGDGTHATPILERLGKMSGGGRGVVLIDRPGSTQATVGVYGPGLLRGDRDEVATRLLGEALQGDLMRELRDVRSLTYGAHVLFGPGREAHPFVVVAPVDLSRAGEALGALLERVTALATTPTSAIELARASNKLVEERRSGWLTDQGLVDWLEQRVLDGAACDAPDDFEARIDAVTPAEIQRVAHAQLDPSNARILVVGDAKALRPQLETLGLGPIEVRAQ